MYGLMKARCWDGKDWTGSSLQVLMQHLKSIHHHTADRGVSAATIGLVHPKCVPVIHQAAGSCGQVKECVKPVEGEVTFR